MMMGSLVQYCAEHERYKCGYCKSIDTNYSHGLWAHTLTASDYQDLIDRGWRRSGKYCYKPTMNLTCCPMYTIRCRALEFKATKSQKKVLKHFNKSITNLNTLVSIGSGDKKMSPCSGDMNNVDIGGIRDKFLDSKKNSINIQDVIASVANSNKVTDNVECDKPDLMKTEQCDKKEGAQAERKLNNVNKGLGVDTTKLPCKKAKQMRKERRLEKLKLKGFDITNLPDTNKNKEKQFEDLLNEFPEEGHNKLKIKLVRTSPPSPEWIASAEESHQLYIKYQTVIHNDKPEKCTRGNFEDFLVNSPLMEEYSRTGPSCGYGSFHQQYWLEGKLIAVGVIDILPKCVSSVYFFYDPQYMNLTLGTYGALREIAFTRELNSTCPDLKYYYMGFYIHSCVKMRYKGKFFPSDLLCPETYKWFPIEDCIPKLDLSPYSRLDPDVDSIDDNYPTENDISLIRIWTNRRITFLDDCRKVNLDEITEYAQLVGAKSARSLILVT